MGLTHWLTQMMTGHEYLHWLRLEKHRWMCVVCTSGRRGGGKTIVELTVLICETLGELRMDEVQPRESKDRTIKQVVGHMLKRADAWRQLSG